MAAKHNQPALGNDWKLTPKQALFVAEYLKDLNATQAAIRAGYSAETAEKNSYRLMGIDGVKQAIAAGTARQLEAAELSANRVLEELRRLALVDIRGFYDGQGNLKPMHLLTPEQGSALAGVETLVRNVEAGDGKADVVYKIKLWDKVKALSTLAQYFGLLVERVQVSGELSTVEARLLAGRKRLAAQRGQE
jgi:phage terminase small subunit